MKYLILFLVFCIPAIGLSQYTKKQIDILATISDTCYKVNEYNIYEVEVSGRQRPLLVRQDQDSVFKYIRKGDITGVKIIESPKKWEVKNYLVIIKVRYLPCNKWTTDCQ